MSVLNGGFELGTGSLGVAQYWVASSNCASILAEFGDAQSAYERFLWGDIVDDVSPWALAPFGGSVPGFETFDWGGFFLEEWDPGWLNTTPVEVFDWSTFNDVFSPGVVSPVEDFVWSTFNDTFNPGASTPVEDFESGW